MEADKGDVVYLAEEHDTMSGVDTEFELEYRVDDTGPETGTEAEADDGQFVVQVEDDEGGSEGKNDENDDNMVVDEDVQSACDQGLVRFSYCSLFSID